jgi:hypothetical protein
VVIKSHGTSVDMSTQDGSTGTSDPKISSSNHVEPRASDRAALDRTARAEFQSLIGEWSSTLQPPSIAAGSRPQSRAQLI